MELDGTSGKFTLDESGHTRFEPSDDELKAINDWISRETEIAEEEYKPLYAEWADSIETYKAAQSQDIIDGEQPIMPAPLARIAVDQLVAWEFNTIMRPTPIASFQPYFNDEYDVVVPPPPELAAQMMQMGQAPTIKKSAEDTAYYIEAGYDYKLRESLKFSCVLRDGLTDMAVVGKCYAKVCREKVDRPLLQPKKNGVFIDLYEKEEEYVRSGDSVKWYSVPVFNILKRLHEDDLDEAEMLQERTPCSAEKFRGRCLSGEYWLVPDEKIDELARQVGDVKTDEQKRVDGTQGKNSPLPKNMVDVRLVWFHRYLKFKDETTGQKTVRRVSLMGDYHAGARQMVNIFRNPYDHQLRPYAVGYQLKDPHSDSGSSTTSISKYFQKVATHLVQAEIKNVFLANNFTPWYIEDGPSAESFAGGVKLRPGKAVVGEYGKDWGVAPIGAEHQSTVPLLNVMRGWCREAQNMSTLESGDSMPSRTPSSSISQVLQQGLQQPLMFLRGIDEWVKRLLLLDLETRKQYEPMGETIPTRDPETRETINVPFRFPLGEVARNFRISLTACDEALAREHEPEQLMTLLSLWQQFTQFVASVVGPMQQASPAQQQLFMRIVDGGQLLFDRIVTLMRTDKQKFDMSKAIGAIKQEIEMMQMQAAQAAEEAAFAEAQAVASGQVPGPAGPPDSGGLEGATGQPGVPIDLSAPPEGVPPSEGIIQ